jgi:hypothetical protein
VVFTQKKTEPVGNVPLPSGNQTKISPPGSQPKLPAVSNKTSVTPAVSNNYNNQSNKHTAECDFD